MHGRITRLLALAIAIFSSVVLAEQLDTKHFSQLPQFVKPELSPKGEKLAYIQNVAGLDTAVLSTYDLTTGTQSYHVKSDNEKVKVNWFEWVNETKLMVSIRYADTRSGTDTTETRLVVLDTEEKNPDLKPLIRPRNGSIRNQHISQFQDNIIDFLPDDPDHILIAIDLDVANMPSVYKVNVNTKKKKRIEKGKRQIRDWMTDQQHRLRLGYVTNYKTAEKHVLIRDNENSKFKEYFHYNSIKDKPIYPIGFDLDPNILYFKQYKGDLLALYKLDLKTNEQTLVFEDPERDVDGGLIYSSKTKDVIGISHSNTATGRIYWDKDRDALQRGLDAALPDTDNYLVAFSRDENVYLMYSESDTVAGVYFLGNREEGSMSLLFSTYPELDPSLLSEHKRISYKARDGIEITGYLTLPKTGEAPYPTIIHPHGGPGARDVDGFDYWTSFFAHRGYAVLRPNFRGSTGYGYEFSQSQMGGWGMAMQDDLEDGLNWLVEDGIANNDKVCIVGASYGGYAAMMGIAKTPDLYKCAVSFSGVSSLKQLVSDSRKYVNSKWVKNQIGSDSDDLKMRSPYYQVENIKTPILVIHGEDDRVVDVKQSRMFADELEDEDKSFEYIELENGDHYLSIQRNRHAAFEAIDEFLKKHLQ